MTEVLSRKDAKTQGLTRYFTGISCPAGHIAERSVSNHGCLACQKIKSLKWMDEHKDRVREINETAKKKYKEKYPERLRLIKLNSLRKRRTEKPDEFRKYQRDYRALKKAADPDGMSISNRQHVKEWREKYPERARATDANKRAKRKAAQETHTGADIQAILDGQQYKCVSCKVCLREFGYHVDHVVPIARGGTNWPDNLQALCPTCNMEKHTKDFSTFMAEKMQVSL